MAKAKKRILKKRTNRGNKIKFYKIMEDTNNKLKKIKAELE